MKKFKFIALIALVSFLAFQSCKKDEVDVTNRPAYTQLKDGMKKLWADHMQWTYSTVDAFFNNPNGLSGQLNRLLQNQKDIGAAIVPYYGQQAGDALAQLLTEHIQLAVPVLESAKNGNQPALEKALADWYKNADDIAHFLTAANPQNWPKDHMEHMMKVHIDQTTGYAVDLLKKDYTSAISKYDEAFSHMLEMADMLSEGIAKQFPNKF